MYCLFIDANLYYERFCTISTVSFCRQLSMFMLSYSLLLLNITQDGFRLC